MSPQKQVLIKLTDEQQKEVQEKLGKEVTHITIKLISGIVLLAEVVQESEPFDGAY